MNNLSGKVIVLTGASSGLGKGSALALAKEGASLVLAARRDELLDELVAECSAMRGAQAISVPTDVTKPREVEALFNAALKKFGRIDIWINDAGVAALGRFEEIPLEDHFKVVETVLLGVITGSFFAMKYFKTQRQGILINVASLLGKVPTPLYSSYVAAKHGVVGLCASIRQELALDKLDEHIHVCTLMPPAMNTPFFEHAANYTGKEPAKIPPVYEPEQAVEKLVRLCTHPEAEVTVGAQGKMFAMAHQIAPDITNAIAAKRTKDATADRMYASPTEGSLHVPDPKGTGIKEGRDPTL